MIIKKMNKEKLISYILRVLVSWIVLFGIGYYKQMHPKTLDEISAVDIQEGIYNLFTKEQKECGYITIKKNDDNILINMFGEEIKGTNVIKKIYTLKPVEYIDIIMKPTTLNYEKYYLCDMGDSYVLLFKIRTENFYIVENYSKIKDKNLYMICEVSHEEYNKMINFSDTMELFKQVNTLIDENRYTCFLEQYSPKVGEKKYKLFKGQ